MNDAFSCWRVLIGLSKDLIRLDGVEQSRASKGVENPDIQNRDGRSEQIRNVRGYEVKGRREKDNNLRQRVIEKLV